MDLAKLREPFAATEIEWRIGRAGLKKDGEVWATALAYIQARAIQDRLDAVCGPLGWKVSYQHVVVGSQIIGVMCEISIKDKEGFWVSKSDGADPTDFEPFKGGISSAFKRCAVQWGIGRYLYDLDEAFVSVCDRGTPGSRYAKHKDKRSNQEIEFHWLTPTLPKWALPENKHENRTASEKVPTTLTPWTADQKREYCQAKWGIATSAGLNPDQKAALLSVCTTTPFEKAMS